MVGGSALIRRTQRPPALPIGLGVIGAGALLAAASSSTGGVFAGCVLAAIGGWPISRPPAARNLPVAPMVVLALLLPAWWLMATIAGPEGLAIGSLPRPAVESGC